MSTGSGLFAFLGSGFAQIIGQIISKRVKTLEICKLRHIKMKKASIATPAHLQIKSTRFQVLLKCLTERLTGPKLSTSSRPYKTQVKGQTQVRVHNIMLRYMNNSVS